MAENLKKETAKGVGWSAVDRFASGGIQFIANIILARILMPRDFGLLAIIAIFIQISQVFIDSGFSNALIQKKDRTQIDYSTVFIFNVGLSLILYIIIFFCAPLIAHFFNNNELIVLTRVVAINLLIGSLAAVHKTKLCIELKFKVQSIISLISSIVAACSGIILAYRGFGIWSLVVLTLSNQILQVVLFYVFIKWRPSLSFSTTSFKSLFSYSSKLLASSIINLLYKNIYPIVIGKKFSALELGYFNRADTYAMYPAYTIGNVISRVEFPILSRIQDDNERLRKAYSKYIIYASVIIFPIMTGMLVLAKPLTIVLLTDKWLPMVPLLQILCIDWMTDHLCAINLNVLYVKGRSDLALKLELIKKSLAILIFFVSLYWGIIGVCWGRVVYGVSAVLINAFYTNSLIGLSISKQLKDIGKPLFITITSGLLATLSISLIDNPFTQIIFGLLAGFLSYMLLLYMFNKNFFRDLLSLIRK